MLSSIRVKAIPVAVSIFALLCVLKAPVAGADPDARGKLTLKVWKTYDVRSNNPADQADLEVIEEFLRRNPHIQIKGSTGISIEGQSDDSRVLMAVAGGMAPDVMNVNFRQSDTYIQQGFLYPLDEFVSTLPEGEIDERVPRPAVPVMYRAGNDGKKHWWALPHNLWVRALIYRKDLFQEVGLNPNQPPRNWSELEEYSLRLTRPEKGTYGLLFQQGPLAAWDWITFLWSAGGDAVALNENNEWQAVFDTDEAVEALLFYTRLYTERWRDSYGNDQYGSVCTASPMQAGLMWKEGKIGMRVSYLDQRTIGGGLDPNIMGIAPVPLGPTGKRGSEINCAMMGIFSDIKGRDGYTPEEIRRAAFDYIRFFGSEEANAIRARVFVERGFGRFINPLWLKKFGYEEYLELVPEGWLEVYQEALRNGKPEPYGKNCQMVYNFMTYPMNEAIALAREGKLGDTDKEKRAKLKELLVAAAARTNEEMIGQITPEERAKRNNVALVVGICLLTGFLLVLWRVWNIFTPKDQPGLKEQGGWQFWKFRWAYIIMLPAVASILLWKYYPMFRGSIMAFQDYRVVGNSKFVGLQNLADVLWDAVWWKSLTKTLYYMALMLGIGFWTPIILAVLLSEVSHGKIAYRTLYYMPAVLTGMVVIYLWKLFFDPSDAGFLNMLIMKLGLPKQGWLNDERLAMICCVIPTVWAGMGPGCLIYLAALKSVPDDLYEAADIDGCGFFKKILYITLPTIKGLIIIQFTGAFIGASQSTRFILVMTFGGPNEATKVAGLHIFEKAYLLLRFGPAVTMAWMLGVAMLGFTTLQLQRLSRMEFATAETRKARQNA